VWALPARFWPRQTHVLQPDGSSPCKYLKSLDAVAVDADERIAMLGGYDTRGLSCELAGASAAKRAPLLARPPLPACACVCPAAPARPCPAQGVHLCCAHAWVRPLRTLGRCECACMYV
jgi:hypothetical protein